MSIVRQLRKPWVQGSLENIKPISAALNEIVSVFKDPQLAKNIEMTANPLRESVAMMHQISLDLNKAGTFEEVNKTLKSARSVISFANSVRKWHDLVDWHHADSARELFEEARKSRCDHRTEQVQHTLLQKKVLRASGT